MPTVAVVPVLAVVGVVAVVVVTMLGGVFVFAKDQPLPKVTPAPSLLGEAIPMGEAEHVAPGGAIAVQVQVQNKKVTIKRVCGVADQGVTVNKDQTEAQWQGGIVDGLATACLQQVTVSKGAVVQSNWGDYPTFTLRNVPPIEFKTVESGPGGMGGLSEMATPLVAGPLANAIYFATGIRVRELPLTKSGFTI